MDWVITDHAARRWVERVARPGDPVAGIRSALAAGFVPSGEGRVTVRHRGRPVDLRVTVEGGVGTVHTVVRSHGAGGNRSEVARVERVAWLEWQAWCRAAGVSPIGSTGAWGAWVAAHDGTITNRTRRMGRAIRKAHCVILGWDMVTAAEQFDRIEVTSATGRRVIL